MSARMRSRVSRCSQSIEHRFDSARLHPGRQNVLQRIGAGGIGIGIAIDVEPARLGGGDHLQRLCGLAPIVCAGALEMDDLDMHAALLGHVDRLRERLQNWFDSSRR